MTGPDQSIQIVLRTDVSPKFLDSEYNQFSNAQNLSDLPLLFTKGAPVGREPGRQDDLEWGLDNEDWRDVEIHFAGLQPPAVEAGDLGRGLRQGRERVHAEVEERSPLRRPQAARLRPEVIHHSKPKFRVYTLKIPVLYPFYTRKIPEKYPHIPSLLTGYFSGIKWV